jgi:hypothetical protein
MRLAAWRRGLGDTVEVRRADNPRFIEPRLDDPAWDQVYASAIFLRTRAAAERVKVIYPGAVIGGTGYDMALTVEDLGCPADQAPDYTDYPAWSQSLGFTQRGCRLRCDFCVVPKKEGAVREVATVWDIWRGEGHPRNLILLDNDFFGQPRWADRIAEILSTTQIYLTVSSGPQDAAAASLPSFILRRDSETPPLPIVESTEASHS